MDSIQYIEDKLISFSTLSTLEKFDFIISSSNILTYNFTGNELIVKQLLDNIISLRYEMASQKAIEVVTVRLDKVLAYEALKLSRLILSGTAMVKPIKDVLYYEENNGYRTTLETEIMILESENK